MNGALSKTVGKLQRSFLEGRSAGQAVVQEREEVVSMLILRDLACAALATRHARSFNEFFEIRRVILSGGPRLMRLQGGRMIDR